MTRKDYIKIADAFAKVLNKKSQGTFYDQGIFDCIDEIKQVFKADNQRFDAGGFDEYLKKEVKTWK